MWEYLFGKSTDLKVQPYPDIDWQASDPRAALKQLAAYVITEAVKAETWYFEKKNHKRLWGILLRAGAILMGAMAGVYPILALLVSNHWGNGLRLEPAWASILLAIAGLCIILDRFGGYTSGWIRYINTGQLISQQLRAFRFAWEIERLKLGATPTPTQIAGAVESCAAFAVAIAGIVEDETKTWAREFETVLQEIQASAKQASQKPVRAALNIEVRNGSDSKGGWKLSIDDGDSTLHRGKTATVAALLPGAHKVVVLGNLNDKPAAAEKTVQVEAGKVLDCSLELVASA